MSLCTIELHFAGGRAKTAPTLSNLQAGETIWEMEGSGAHAVTNDGGEYKGDTAARSQRVVNNRWCNKWYKTVQPQVYVDYEVNICVRQHQSPSGRARVVRSDGGGVADRLRSVHGPEILIILGTDSV